MFQKFEVKISNFRSLMCEQEFFNYVRLIGRRTLDHTYFKRKDERPFSVTLSAPGTEGGIQKFSFTFRSREVIG